MERTSHTILLVDDDPDLLGGLLNRFRADRERWQVLTASCGKQALDTLSSRPVDVVVTDILMPDKDGLELVMEMRKAHPDVKIVAMSGGGAHIGTQPLGVALRFGAHGTLEKPFAFERLVGLLEQLTAGPTGRSPGP